MAFPRRRDKDDMAPNDAEDLSCPVCSPKLGGMLQRHEAWLYCNTCRLVIPDSPTARKFVQALL